jgi:hypothetical protein
VTGRGALAAALLALHGAFAWAEDGMPPPGAGAAMGETKPKEAPKPISDTEAAPLVEGLKKAAKAKVAEDALRALDAIEGKANPQLEGPLVRLLSHNFGEVAGRAADALAERAGPKTGAVLWKSGFQHGTNLRRPEVQASILAAMGKVGAPLDERQYGDVESLWRKATTPKAKVAIASYFGAIKTDKRPLRWLSEALDEPVAGDPNDASTPPASVLEAQWKLWKGSLAAVEDAIRAITGQTFHTSAQAKAWFKANEKTFGFVW